MFIFVFRIRIHLNADLAFEMDVNPDPDLSVLKHDQPFYYYYEKRCGPRKTSLKRVFAVIFNCWLIKFSCIFSVEIGPFIPARSGLR